MAVNKDMGKTGAGNNVASGGGSSKPGTPSGSGSTNKKQPASNNIGNKGGSLKTNN
jgi:hypothetical protein